MSWKNIEVTMPNVSAVLDSVKAASVVLDAIDLAYEIISPIIRLLLAAQSSIDGVGATGVAAIQAAKILVQSLNSEAGVYLLSVPVLASSKGTISPPHMPIRSLGDIASAYGVAQPAADDNRAGNYGLFKTIVESLYDTGDISRPSLDPRKYTAATLLVYGGDTFIEALPQIVALSELFGRAVPIPIHGYVLPVPRNVKLRSIPTPAKSVYARVLVNIGSMVQSTSLVVRWDADAPYTRLPGYANTTTRRIAWRIYVKPNSRIEAGEDLATYQAYQGEIVSASVPSVGTLYEDNSYGAVLTGLDPDQVYYVSVAYVVEIYDSSTGAKTTIQPVTSSLSDQQRVRMRERPTPRQFSRGIPPDWIALKSSLGAIPAVADAVERLSVELELLEANISGNTQQASATLAAALAVPQRVKEKLLSITDQVARAARVVAQANGGVWVTAYASKGGEAGLIQWLQHELLDEGVPNQPPFRKGTGVVGAMMFVAQADSLAEAQSALGVLSEIVSGNTSAPPAILSIADPTRGVNPAVSPPAQTTTTTPLKDLGVGDDPC